MNVTSDFHVARGWSCISAGCSIQARKVIQLSRLPTQVLWTGKDPDVIHQSRQDKTILMTEKTMRIFICLPLLLQSWERLRIGIPTCSWRNFPVPSIQPRL
ncbi:hypothetical protein Moror_14081 [Moniliophthora roreri MCA 2997]|uniref:Uncharacterized protein n=1 Tax=Moniliophthora roreri (strain MCA 2997) TaxID=1381753 RepID=V2YTB2_MONRO|nr:hypothetical protein Moror_14081 [Moniliophthora roreri MCA 2997]